MRFCKRVMADGRRLVVGGWDVLLLVGGLTPHTSPEFRGNATPPTPTGESGAGAGAGTGAGAGAGAGAGPQCTLITDKTCNATTSPKAGRAESGAELRREGGARG